MKGGKRAANKRTAYKLGHGRARRKKGKKKKEKRKEKKERLEDR